MSPRKGKKRKLEGPVESAQNPHSKASTSSAEQPAIAGETVDINFVFFSHSGPNSALPQSVSVPKDLLQRSLSICVPEFANALQRIFNFTAVRDVTFDFYEVSCFFFVFLFLSLFSVSLLSANRKGFGK